MTTPFQLIKYFTLTASIVGLSLFTDVLQSQASTGAPELGSKCASLFELYKFANASARLPIENYKEPNKRSLLIYKLVIGLDRFSINDQSVVIDLGGGLGVAMQELAQETGCRAININTQKMASLPENAPPSYEYVQGWAEEILPKYQNQATHIIDLWGAFSYTILKTELIEKIYDSLQMGGEARIYFNYFMTPTQVIQPDGKAIDFDRWLASRFPEIVSIEDANTRMASEGYIMYRTIVIKKKSNSSFRIPLKMISYIMQHGKFPSIDYEEISLPIQE